MANSAETDSPFRVGAVIDGKYEIVSFLGAGGMGDVFKALHVHLDAFRTIKRLRKDLLADESHRARFSREAQLATRVQHPSVALVYDFATLPDGTSYIVSEFIEGVTLRRWMQTHGRFAMELGLQIATQVLLGLEVIHRAGLVHRDLSPDNIMISTGADNAPLAKIIDLGLAKAADGGPLDGVTQAGTYLGNPRYSSPEHFGALREGEAIDARADIYSFGAVLYEILTGAPPFSSHTPHGYAAQHLTQPAPSLRTHDASLPESVDRAVLKALQKSRDDRYQSAREMRAALAPFRTDRLTRTTETKLEGLREEGKNSLASMRREVAVPATVRDDEEVAELDAGSGLEQEQHDWDKAIDAGTDSAWAQYLARHPDSRRAAEARKLRDEARHFAAAMQMPTPEALRSFLEAWPTSRFKTQVESQLSRYEQRSTERAAFDAATDALHAGDRRPAEELLQRTEAPHIRQRLKVLLAGPAASEEEQGWNAAMSEDTEAVWMAFIERYRGSPLATKAISVLAEIRDYQRATAAGTELALRVYLATWPRGRHSAAAAARLHTILDGKDSAAPPQTAPVAAQAVPAIRTQIFGAAIPQTVASPLDATHPPLPLDRLDRFLRTRWIYVIAAGIILACVIGIIALR